MSTTNGLFFNFPTKNTYTLAHCCPGTIIGNSDKRTVYCIQMIQTQYQWTRINIYNLSKQTDTMQTPDFSKFPSIFSIFFYYLDNWSLKTFFELLPMMMTTLWLTYSLFRNKIFIKSHKWKNYSCQYSKLFYPAEVSLFVV